jgi:hypothetical protein
MWQCYITFSAKIKALWRREKDALPKPPGWLIAAIVAGV